MKTVAYLQHKESYMDKSDRIHSIYGQIRPKTIVRKKMSNFLQKVLESGSTRWYINKALKNSGADRIRNDRYGLKKSC